MQQAVTALVAVVSDLPVRKRAWPVQVYDDVIGAGAGHPKKEVQVQVASMHVNPCRIILLVETEYILLGHTRSVS